MKRAHQDPPSCYVTPYAGNRIRDAITRSLYRPETGDALSNQPVVLRCIPAGEVYYDEVYMAYWPSDATVGERLVRSLDDEKNQDHAALTLAVLDLWSGQLTDESMRVGDRTMRHLLLKYADVKNLTDIGLLKRIPPRDQTWPLPANSVAEEHLSPHLFILNCIF